MESTRRTSSWAHILGLGWYFNGPLPRRFASLCTLLCLWSIQMGGGSHILINEFQYTLHFIIFCATKVNRWKHLFFNLPFKLDVWTEKAWLLNYCRKLQIHDVKLINHQLHFQILNPTIQKYKYYLYLEDWNMVFLS